MNRTTATTVGMLAATLLLGTGCTTIGSSNAATNPTTTTTVQPTQQTDAAVPANSDSTSTNTRRPATTTRPPTHPTTTTHKPTTTTPTNHPVVESLTVVTKPTCPVVGTPAAPYSKPGTDVVIAWKVKGADKAAIAVDNPGVYGAYGSDYPSSGQLSLSFPCGSGPGSSSHTYTVWPAGAKSVSKTITVTAKHNA